MGQCLKLVQTSITNQKFPHNGVVEYKLDTKDILVVTSYLPELGVKAIRRFQRINDDNDQEKSRRHSVL